MKKETICIHGAEKWSDECGSVALPIFASSTFSHDRIGVGEGYDYSRMQNPTREHVERALAALEHGVDAIAFSSGMAAITTAFDVFGPGDKIVISDDIYGGTYRLFQVLKAKSGLEFVRVDTSDIAAVEAAVDAKTKAVFVESPTNPMMKITDIGAVAKITKRHGIKLFVDNTFLTPYFINPLELGADVVLHSATKYLGGHNDVLAGVLVTSDTELAAKYRYLYKTTGACLSAFDSWLLHRGLKTLAVRMEKQQENAAKIVEWLQTCPAVKAVYYPSLNKTDKDISDRQGRGYGAMVSFETGSFARVEQVLARVKVITFAESLGGVETLITYPTVQTHGDIPPDERAKLGISDRLLRLSVGLEHYTDLIEDLEQALR